MPDIETLSAVAVAAARKAGDIQREKYGGILNVDAKLAGDLKLEADRLCEAAIVRTVREHFPDHAILAEEGGMTEGAEYIWYIDPLDGTVNFYYGIPYFCTTLACYRRSGGDDAAEMGEPVLGVTHMPLSGELYRAARGKGAFLNDRPIRVREEDGLEDAYVITALGNNAGKLSYTREVILELSLRVRKTRNLGAAALDLAMTAAGRASGYMEYGINPWDFAAGRLLVEEAGGLFTTRPLGNGKFAVAASGRNIHRQLVEAMDRGTPGASGDAGR